MKKTDSKTIIGTVSFVVILLIICFWTYWGINEAFHEGWYYASFWQNIKLTLIQYLSIPIILIISTIITINNKKIGSIIFFLFGLFALFFFNSNSGRVVIFLPTTLIASGFWLGKLTDKKLITFIITSVPFLITIFFGLPQLIRVNNRVNDGNFGLRTVNGNGVELTWAPQGIGFPLNGSDWFMANEICSRLNEGGTELENQNVDFWRLPTKDEIVRSLTKKNINAEGMVNETGSAEYQLRPDKETPLWNPHSKIIYYWTSKSTDENQAFLIAYNGKILSRNKNSGADYQGYRCVRNY